MKKRADRFIKNFGKGLKDIRDMMPDRKTVRDSFGTVTFRRGTYSAAAVALVVMIAVVLNMIAGQLPEDVK